MRRTTLRTYFVHGFFLLLALAVVSLATFFLMPVLLQATLLGVFLFLFVLLLIILPIGKLPIGGLPTESSPVGKFWPWFRRIILMQLLLYFLWFALFVPLMVPSIPSEVAKASAHFWFLSFAGSLLYQGLHPWTLCACLAVAVGVVGHSYGQEKISGAARALVSKNMSEAFFSALDINAMGLTALFLFNIVGLAAYSVLLLLHDYGLVPALLPGQLGVGFTCILLGIFLSQGFWRKRLQQKTARQSHLAMLLLRLMVVSVMMMSAYAILLQQSPADAQAQLQENMLSTPLTAEVMQLIWFYLYWGLGLQTVPLVTMWLVSHSRGRSARQLILAVIALPLLLASTLQMLFDPNTLGEAEKTNLVLDKVMSGLSQLYSEPFIYYWPLLAFLVFLLVIWRSPAVNQAIIDMTANLAGKNMRRLRSLLIGLSPLIAWNLLIYFILGLAGMQYFSGFVSLGVFLCSFLPALLALLKVCWRPHKHLSLQADS